MTGEQPTGDAGASVIQQIEGILSAGEKQPEQEGEKPQEAPQQPEAPEGDEQGEPEGPQYELSDVAKILGLEESMLDVDEDGSLKIKTKIDGVEGAAKLNDFIKSYQLQGHVDARVRKHAEKEKQFSEHVAQVEQFAQAKLQELGTAAQLLDQFLMQEFANVNWDQLVSDDPIQYTAKRHEYDRRSQMAGQFRQSVQHKAQEISQAMAWRQQQEVQQELGRLPGLIPEWKDQASVETGFKDLQAWLSSKGVNPNKGLMDAGMIAVLYDAMKGSKSAPKVAAAEAKVRAAPKLVRPGQGSDATQRKADSVRGLKQQINESGGKSTDAIAKWLLAAGKV